LLDLLTAADAAAARGAPPGAPPLVLAGDINWGTFDLQKLQGHCWSTRAAHSLEVKRTQVHRVVARAASHSAFARRTTPHHAAPRRTTPHHAAPRNMRSARSSSGRRRSRRAH
jgi:hypothetical protein